MLNYMLAKLADTESTDWDFAALFVRGIQPLIYERGLNYKVEEGGVLAINLSEAQPHPYEEGKQVTCQITVKEADLIRVDFFKNSSIISVPGNMSIAR